MLRLRRGFRVAFLLVAMAQIAIPSALVVLDGIATTRSVGSMSHVESGSGKGCVPAHTADCAVCRCLSTAAAKVCAIPAAVLRTAGAPLTTLRDDRALSVSRRRPHSRAPPHFLV